MDLIKGGGAFVRDLWKRVVPKKPTSRDESLNHWITLNFLGGGWWGGETALERWQCWSFFLIRMLYCRVIALVIRVIGRCGDCQCSGQKNRTSASSNMDILSCREPPSEIKHNPTQPICCGIGMDLDQIPQWVLNIARVVPPHPFPLPPSGLVTVGDFYTKAALVI